MTLAEAPTLAERLTAAQLEVETLDRASGVAALDGEPFDHAALAMARANVDAIVAAEREARSRDADTAASEQAARRTQAALEARQALSDYTAATKAAHTATVALVASIKAALASADTIRRSALAAGGKPVGAAEENEVRRVISRLIAGDLVPVVGNRFGDLRYPSVELRASWTAYTDKYIAPAIEAAIARGQACV